MKDGWHTIQGKDVYIRDGFIRYGIKPKWCCTVHVYRWSRQYNGWIKEDKITPAAFAAGVRRGTIGLL